MTVRPRNIAQDTSSRRTLEKLMAALLTARQAIVDETFREPDGTIYLSVGDAKELDEQSRRCGEYLPLSEIKVGSTGTMFGLPFEAVDLPRGVAFIGRRVDVNTPTCDHCGQELPQ